MIQNHHSVTLRKVLAGSLALLMLSSAVAVVPMTDSTALSSAVYAAGETIESGNFVFTQQTDDTLKLTQYKVPTIAGTTVSVPSTVDGYTVTAVGAGVFTADMSLDRLYLPDSVTTIESGAVQCNPEVFVSSQSISLNVVTAMHGSGGSTELVEAIGTSKAIPVFVRRAGESDIDYLEYINGEFVDFTDWLLFVEDGIDMYDYRDASRPYVIYKRDASAKTITVTSVSDGFNISGLFGMSTVSYQGETYSLRFELDNTLLCEKIGNTDNYKVTGYLGSEQTLDIAEELPDKNITQIADSAFFGNSNLRSVTMPDTVTSIGKDAFSGCSNLSQVNMPAALESIGESAFAGTAVTEVTVPETVKEIGAAAFAGCQQLTKAAVTGYPAEESEIPGAIVDYFALPESMFEGCSALTEVELGDYVYGIGKNVFSGTALKTLQLPEFCTDLNNVFGTDLPDGFVNLTIKKGYVLPSTMSEAFGAVPGIVVILDNPDDVDWDNNPMPLASEPLAGFEGVYYIDSAIDIVNAAEGDSFADTSKSYCTYILENNKVKVKDAVQSEYHMRSADANADTLYLDNQAYAVEHKVLAVEEKKATCTDGGYQAHSENELGVCVDGSGAVLSADAIAALQTEKDEVNGHEYVNGTCIHCGRVESEIGARVVGHSLSLDGSIGVNFYMKLKAAYVKDENAVIRFTLPDGKTSDVKLNTAEVPDGTNDDDYVLCSYQCRVAPKEINDTITAQVIINEDNKSAEYTYSVKEYADYVIEHSDEFFDGDESRQAQFSQLAQYMLNYGSYAQTYFKYTDNAIDPVALCQTEMNKMTAENLDTYFDGYKPENYIHYYSSAGTEAETPDAQTSFVGANLILESNTSMRLYFKLTDPDKVKFSYGDTDEELTATAYSGDYYYVEISDIAAQKLGDKVTVRAINTEDNSYMTVEYCPMTYMYLVLSRNRAEDLQNLVKAYYFFGINAKNFLGEK